MVSFQYIDLHNAVIANLLKYLPPHPKFQCYFLENYL